VFAETKICVETDKQTKKQTFESKKLQDLSLRVLGINNQKE